MNDFWIACGHHLLDRDESGGLCVTDEFLKAYFARPELMPPDEACPVERQLHRELLAAPRQPISTDEIAAIADMDARENWRFVLAFRDLLVRHPTLEAAYLATVRSRASDFPPLFVNEELPFWSDSGFLLTEILTHRHFALREAFELPCD